MPKLIFLLIFLINHLLIKSQSYPTQSPKITLLFHYHHQSLNRILSISINGIIIPKSQLTTAAYILNGNVISRKTLNISSVTCTTNVYSDKKICQNKQFSLYIILKKILYENSAIKIEGKNSQLENILHLLYLNESNINLTCTIETIHDSSKDFNRNPLSKTSLFGIIFLTACVVLTFGLCIGWFVVVIYRRFEQNRTKTKLRKALEHSVQQLLDKSPIILFDSKKKNHDYIDDDPMCAVCLELFLDNEKLRKLVCSHYFHVECIDPWLLSHQSCPLCNQNILTDAIPSISARITAANDEVNDREIRSINIPNPAYNNSIIEPQNLNS